MNRQRVADVAVLECRDGRCVTTQHHAPVEWSFYRQARGFVAALAGEEPPRAPADECLRDVRVMHRLIEIAEMA